MPSLFTKIIQKKTAAYIVAEDIFHIAFLDIAPIARGHTLVVPKKEVDYLFDLADKALGRLMIFAKKVATGLRKIVPCRRIGMAVLGLEVPHAHLHLVPIQEEKDLNLSASRLVFLPDVFAELAGQIQAVI